jgi:inner membrane protein
MPTIISHALAGASLSRLAGAGSVASSRADGLKVLLLCATAAMLPDLDVVTFKFGIPYASPWGHRGVSHSLLLALLAALLLTACSRGLWQRLGWSLRSACLLLFAVIASHAGLDMLTDATHGPALFMPFDMQRYLLPWRPIEGAPISPRLWLTAKGWRVVYTELPYVWLPCLMLWLLRVSVERRKEQA